MRYEESEEIDRPAELYGQAVCLVQNRYLYTIGGTTGHFYQMDVNRLDLVTKKWKLLKKGTNGLGMLENQPHEPAARFVFLFLIWYAGAMDYYDEIRTYIF